MSVWWGQAGEIATGKVDDTSGAVTEAWTGPQVAWKMARGSPGAFGGKEINSVPLWLGFCALFFFGLADLRRPLSLRNLDLLALLSFSVSLWYFNRGDVFTSVPLAYPPLDLPARANGLERGPRAAANRRRAGLAGLGARGCGRLRGRLPHRPQLQSSNVIDVGYSGVVGADRIAHGQVPYGNFPIEGSLKACGPADSEGEIRNRIQENGRCESANPERRHVRARRVRGVPARLRDSRLERQVGRPPGCPLQLDLLRAALRLRRRRSSGFASGAPGSRSRSPSRGSRTRSRCTRRARTRTTRSRPLFLIWGFWLVTSPAARGAAVALSGWTKFAPLVVAPLWASYPEPFKRPREKAIFVAAFLAASAVAFSILLLDGHPLHAAHVFWTRTLGWQIGRDSPFSLWDWRQYHAGLPDLQVVQRVLEGLLIAGAIAAYFLPRRKSPLQLAALTAALLLGFQLVLTHWFYLYLPWFFPFAAFAVLAPAPRARAGARIPAA